MKATFLFKLSQNLDVNTGSLKINISHIISARRIFVWGEKKIKRMNILEIWLLFWLIITRHSLIEFNILNAIFISAKINSVSISSLCVEFLKCKPWLRLFPWTQLKLILWNRKAVFITTWWVNVEFRAILCRCILSYFNNNDEKSGLTTKLPHLFYCPGESDA